MRMRLHTKQCIKKIYNIVYKIVSSLDNQRIEGVEPARKCLIGGSLPSLHLWRETNPPTNDRETTLGCRTTLPPAWFYTQRHLIGYTHTPKTSHWIKKHHKQLSQICQSEFDEENTSLHQFVGYLRGDNTYILDFRHISYEWLPILFW